MLHFDPLQSKSAHSVEPASNPVVHPSPGTGEGWGPGAGPGLVALFGSGETSPSGRKAFDLALQRCPRPARVAILETPAGFELNSERVAGRVAEFLRLRLQNYAPQTTLIAARRRGTPFSPDEAEIVAPLLETDLIFTGPGSPTYAVRQLRDSLAWYYLTARHRLGSPLVMASAAVIACSAYALPVYEIYKVGEDLHWKEGLDFFAPYGLRLVFIPHWNNNDGGDELDTSRCFMGQSRFARLMEMLPGYLTVVGIDEQTVLLMDLQAGECQVVGTGLVTVVHTGHGHKGPAPLLQGSGLAEVSDQRSAHVHQYASGQRFPLGDLGPFSLPHPDAGIPPDLWREALAAQARLQLAATCPPEAPPGPPEAVLALAAERQAARQNREWGRADALRQQILALGWQVLDTPDGTRFEKSVG